MERSKALSINRRNSMMDDDELFKSMRANSSKMPIPSSASLDQAKRMIDKLEKVAREEKERREEIETKFLGFKQRVVSRQREFHKILSKYDPSLPGQQKQENFDNYVTQIYNKILLTFEAFNQKARSLLDDRYNELYRLMQRRIDILMQKMDKQLAKHRKISLTERKQLQEAIREIGVIAAETESDNAEFRKKNEEMEMRLKILNDEKRLLVEEITTLKVFVKEGVKLKEKEERERNKEGNNCQINPQVENQGVKKQFWNNVESIQLHNDNNEPKKSRQTQRRSLTGRKYNKRNQVKSSEYKVSVLKQGQNNSTLVKHPMSALSSKGNNKDNNNKKTIDVYKLQRDIVSQENVINHLRQQLTREKAKNGQLIRFSLELEAKQIKLIELVGVEMREIVSKREDGARNSVLISQEEGCFERESNCESSFSGYDGREEVKIQGALLNVKRVSRRERRAVNNNNNNKSNELTKHKPNSKGMLIIDTSNNLNDWKFNNSNNQNNNQNSNKKNNIESELKNIEEQLDAHKKRFNNFVISINKILQLPQDIANINSAIYSPKRTPNTPNTPQSIAILQNDTNIQQHLEFNSMSKDKAVDKSFLHPSHNTLNTLQFNPYNPYNKQIHNSKQTASLTNSNKVSQSKYEYTSTNIPNTVPTTPQINEPKPVHPLQLNLLSKSIKQQPVFNKITSKRYQTLNRNKKNSHLFTNYSPLDIIDITKSIQINY